ncbi:MAG: hypothetical protein K9H48_19925 [Melioribacteraceae bacterium]|nr:hypothetical protein [Melioribacteraceae bacterium]
MSGPKFFTVDVFDKSLKEIFQIQSKIHCLVDELSQLSVNDNDRNIYFNCIDFIKLHQPKVTELLSTYNINFTGTINQEKYNKYQEEINHKTKELKLFLSILEKEKISFKSKKEDYKAFLDYEIFYNHSLESFDSFKTQLINYLESYLKDNNLQLFNNTKASIEAIKIKVKKAMFGFCFQNKKPQKQTELQKNIRDCETLINDIRIKLSDEVSKISDKNLSISSQIDLTKLPNFNKNTQEVQTEIKKIDNWISKITNPFRKNKYKDQLENLIQSQSLKDVYFYKELFDDIRQTEKMYFWKTEIKEILFEINQLTIHKKVEPEKNILKKYCLSLICKQKLKKYEYDDVLAKMLLLKKKNEKAKNDEFIKAKENLFLKEQLIKNLENMNYEVMTDMEVIDFENESDFLFHIPKQDNYLNLRFKPDCSFSYNFVIPEKRDELSINQKKRKLVEMEATCNEFKKLLTELSSMGLNFKKNSEMPISEDTLIQVPKKHIEKITKDTTVTKKRKLKKAKYLNK